MRYNYEKEKIRGVEYKYSAEWIYDLESEEHWRLYWNQQKLMQNKVRSGDHALEIGVGSGFTANFLKSKGVNIRTLDIDQEKNPDIVANLVEYPFPDRYDHVLAFEVFEHIPFVEFKSVLDKISKVCKKYIFLSVPRNERVWLQLNFQFPIIGEKELRFATLRGKVIEPAHFWEIGDGSVSIDDLEQVFGKYGFTILTRTRRFSRIFYALKINQATSN
jgi:2-polyprenyl-3-methyl-5-hydroxy-6-metoxy-1,4-benzoquinol methylase